MAGAADKKQAQRNVETLSSVHKLSIIINVVSVLCLFVLKRPSSKKYYLIYSIPAFFCEYTIEKIGRPKFDHNVDGYKILVKPGDDLQQSGLTEYMFDIIYLTLLIDLLMCITGSNKVWWISLAVPAFAFWKLRGILGTILGFIMPRRNKSSRGEDGETESGAPLKSKRQQKLEKRGEKVRYR